MKASIVMPTWNQVQYLAPAIESCLRQTYPDTELVIVNDGSTDSTPKLLKWFASQHPQITIVNQRHSGQAKAMNQGIKAATGDIICFAASDDLQEPRKVEILVDGIHTGVEFCYSGYYHANVKGEIWEEVHPKELTIKTIKDNTAFSGGAVAAKKSIFTRVPFRENLLVNEDMALAWDLYRLGLRYTIIDIPTFRYRLTQESMSYSRKKEVEAVTAELTKEIDIWRGN